MLPEILNQVQIQFWKYTFQFLGGCRPYKKNVLKMFLHTLKKKKDFCKMHVSDQDKQKM